MLSALTPNTAAFLEYISPHADDAPTSLPPAALFNNMPVPGRDTPEDTPPSAPSTNDSQLNEHSAHDDDDDGSHTPDILQGQVDDADSKDSLTGNGTNKRKAGRPSAVVDDDEDASDSDFPSGHEDKKQHGSGRAAVASASGSGRRGARKSGGGEGDGKRELSKSERRKEQNRAAQKAFRERREAKVKDQLEDKVAELESKAYGTQIENENLRGILKRLQEENVALKQSAFTFSMPVNNRNSPNASNGSFSVPAPQKAKPPTPPQSSKDDSLKSVNDIPMLPHRHSSTNAISEANSESLVSLGSADRTPPALFSDQFNSFALGPVRIPSTSSPSQSIQKYPVASNKQQSMSSNSNSSSGISPPSADQSEFNALWESLYPNGVENLANQNANQNQGGPFTLLNSQPDSMSFASMFNLSPPSSTNPARPSVNPAPASVSQPANHITQNLGATGQASDWNRFAFREPTAEASVPNWDLTDNTVNDFLASLSGDTTADTTANEYFNNDDEAFNAQLRKIFGDDNSPSAAFNLPSTSFSPNNYLNMSPSPMMPLSNSQSPQSSDSRSNTNASSSGGGHDISMTNSPQYSMGSSRTSVSHHESPELQAGGKASTSATTGTGVKDYTCKASNEIIHVVDEKGRIVKPSELWVRFGMQYENQTEHLLIDDLCEQMRAKATCKDGKMQLDITDAAVLFQKGEGQPHSYAEKIGKKGANQTS
ncbi:hypothetical protein I307_02084 [Cryptococcus deuterogattii 99/473]|uniref:BZIP domain-containing protein n=1 Tax=Cryptococcus deuterogattii Ram5 TaxID=1296110 RepID=A0A0D0TXS3_9TREE|nr:hypothetical protein I313_03305 [Cryptococcus deuterogattii Ram5]KIY58289.1 hypothetical protein I307_02084 [Cryptococcus deuterogattii 99/473]